MINGRKYFALVQVCITFTRWRKHGYSKTNSRRVTRFLGTWTKNAKQIRAIGGRFDTQDKSQETLGEVEIKDANEKAF